MERHLFIFKVFVMILLKIITGAVQIITDVKLIFGLIEIKKYGKIKLFSDLPTREIFNFVTGKTAFILFGPNLYNALSYLSFLPVHESSDLNLEISHSHP